MADRCFEFPTTGITVDKQAVLLAIDDALLPLKKNLCYYLSRPSVRAEPILKPQRDNPNAPDYTATHFYGTVLHDEGRFRLWHYAASPAEQPGMLHEGPVCYAESDDGLEWTRPHLGQVEFKGSRDNHAIALPGTATEGSFIVKDDDDPDPDRRYKMVYEVKSPRFASYTVRTATSPDGIHWTAGPDLPLKEGIEPCSFYRYNGLYIINAQFAPSLVSEGGHRGGRQGFVWISTDFDTWLEEAGESFTLPEPADPSLRGLAGPYDQVHLGTAAFGYGNVMVGLYCIWHSRPNPGDWFGQTTTSGDLGLVVSNDGIHFREPVKGHVYLAGQDSPPTPVPGKSFPVILCQGNGFLNIGDETRIYHGRWRNAPYVNPTITIDPAHKDDYYQNLYYAEIGLATLPRDRWGALGLFPNKDEGAVWTAPIVLPEGGCAITLNADAASAMRVELADERFVLLPDYSGAASGTTTATDGFDCPVEWPHGDLSALGGRRVRLRIHLRRVGDATPRLYAAYLTAA